MPRWVTVGLTPMVAATSAWRQSHGYLLAPGRQPGFFRSFPLPTVKT